MRGHAHSVDKQQMATSDFHPLQKPVRTSCLIWRMERDPRRYGRLTQSWHLLERRDTLIREIQLRILDLAGLIEHLLRF